MPDQETLERAREDKREGKAPSTQAGEFVREEIEHIREGKHGARSTKQAIAIGLSKARRAGVTLAAPKKGRAPESTRKQAQRDLKRGRSSAAKKVSAKRSRAVRAALKREGRSAVSPKALAKQARSSAKRHTAKERSAAAKKAVRTKGPAKRSAAAQRAARTRAKRG
ncbi:MAG: DNA-binding protein [Gemmatimonadota bacterium]|nr:DNA-binding protein [Gemmatimonadota bacterium]